MSLTKIKSIKLQSKIQLFEFVLKLPEINLTLAFIINTPKNEHKLQTYREF